MKRLLMAYALLFIAHLAVAETHVPAGPISGTWTLAGSPYLIEGNVIIEISGSLTIEPGVVVVLNPYCRFRIEGRLLALGTVNDSIRFVAADTVIGSEGLHFLNTNYSPLDSSKLVYCEISYGTATGQPDPYMHGGGIFVQNSSRLLLSHCYLHHCRTANAYGSNGSDGSGGYPIGNPGSPGGLMRAGNGGALYVESCSPNVFSCTFAYNFTGDGCGGAGGNGAAIADSLGHNLHGGNGGNGGDAYGGFGGAIYLKNAGANLRDNIFHHNHTGSGFAGHGGNGGPALAGRAAYGGAGGLGAVGYGGDGGAIYMENSTTQMDNNLIYANYPGTGIGGGGGNGGSAVVPGPYYWTAVPGAGGNGGNGNGGDGYALFAAGSTLVGIRLATVTQHNLLSLGQGGAGGLSGDGVPATPGQGFNGTGIIGGPALLLVNAIVWNNVEPTIDPPVTVSYSCIQGGHTGIGVIAVDPLFVNVAQQQFYLSQIAAGQTQNSPCVDTGNPSSFMISGTTRTDNVQDSGRIDMGYHYPIQTFPPQIDVTLTPINPPIRIPAGGGSFSFNASLTNFGSVIQNFQAWIMQQTPSGSWQGPMLGPLNLTLWGGLTISRQRTQNVPSTAPPGVYTYRGYVGVYPDTRWDSSGFTYEKLATGVGGIVYSWSCTGESFPGEKGSSGNIYPSSFILYPSVPNPFNPTTVVRYQMPDARFIHLRVYDISGRLVTTLVNGWRPAGSHEVTFDGSRLASGLYFVKMQAGNFSSVQKMMLLK